MKDIKPIMVLYQLVQNSSCFKARNNTSAWKFYYLIMTHTETFKRPLGVLLWKGLIEDQLPILSICIHFAISQSPDFLLSYSHAKIWLAREQKDAPRHQQLSKHEKPIKYVLTRDVLLTSRHRPIPQRGPHWWGDTGWAVRQNLPISHRRFRPSTGSANTWRRKITGKYCKK